MNARRSRWKLPSPVIELDVINRDIAATAVDYPASQTNLLYKHFTGRFLYPEEPYEVDGLHRDTVKYLVSMTLNNGSRQGAAMAARRNLDDLTKIRQERLEIGVKHFGGYCQINFPGWGISIQSGS